MEGEQFSFDLAAMSGANFSMGSSFQDVTAGLDGSAVVSTGGPAAVPTSDSIVIVIVNILLSTPQGAFQG